MEVCTWECGKVEFNMASALWFFQMDQLEPVIFKKTYSKLL